jgi:hypothetical protein
MLTELQEGVPTTIYLSNEKLTFKKYVSKNGLNEFLCTLNQVVWVKMCQLFASMIWVKKVSQRLATLCLNPTFRNRIKRRKASKRIGFAT